MKTNRCERIRDLIERFFDGETTKKENLEIQRHIKVCAECRKLVILNQEISDFFSTLPELKCPEELYSKILANTVKRKGSSKKHLIDTHTLFNWKNAVVGIAFSAAIVFLVIKPNIGTETYMKPVVYQEQDIEKAKKQAEWTLKLIGRKLNKSEIKAFKEVFYTNLPKTVTKSLEQSVPILFGGEK